MTETALFDFNRVQEDQALAGGMRKLFARLQAAGFARMWRIPTYPALEHYRRAIRPEDCYYRRHSPASGLIFKESGNQRWFIPAELQDTFDLFKGLVTTGEVEKDILCAALGEELFAELSTRGLLNPLDGHFALPFRVVPTPYGWFLADPMNSRDPLAIHIGLDSVLFTNFLVAQGTTGPSESILDLGCGTAIHAMVMRTVHPWVETYCVDLNPRALACARANAFLNGSTDGMNFIQSNWFDALPRSDEKQYDLVMCNPPFEWRKRSEKEARVQAGYGGETFGLDQTLSVLTRALSFLAPAGRAFVMTQTPVTATGELLVTRQDDDLLNRLSKEAQITIHLLYEHLLVSVEQMRLLRENDLSHFALVVNETCGAQGRGLVTRDARPRAKQTADRRRVAACLAYWKKQLEAGA
jgi:SAM-dependent methyltransferase